MQSTPSSVSKRYYAGIGSRETPLKVQRQMTSLAEMLEGYYGFTLRSGNADGADQAFARGVNVNADIWLPWKNFNEAFRKVKPLHNYREPSAYDMEAEASVNVFHPKGPSLGPLARKFMARNYRQVIGLDEPNSEFVIAWTPDGKPVGGTAQAIRIAKKYGITYVNMFGDVTAQRVIDYLSIWHEL
jgi:hypothetical protein